MSDDPLRYTLPKPPPRHVCPQGHVQEGDFRLSIDELRSRPLCAVCIVEFMDRNFPTLALPD